MSLGVGQPARALFIDSKAVIIVTVAAHCRNIEFQRLNIACVAVLLIALSASSNVRSVTRYTWFDSHQSGQTPELPREIPVTQGLCPPIPASFSHLRLPPGGRGQFDSHTHKSQQNILQDLSVNLSTLGIKGLLRRIISRSPSSAEPILSWQKLSLIAPETSHQLDFWIFLRPEGIARSRLRNASILVGPPPFTMPKFH